VDAKSLFPVHDFRTVYAGLRIPMPRSGITEDDRHGGQRSQILLVDETQLVLV